MLFPARQGVGGGGSVLGRVEIMKIKSKSSLRATNRRGKFIHAAQTNPTMGQIMREKCRTRQGRTWTHLLFPFPPLRSSCGSDPRSDQVVVGPSIKKTKQQAQAKQRELLRSRYPVIVYKVSYLFNDNPFEFLCGSYTIYLFI